MSKDNWTEELGKLKEILNKTSLDMAIKWGSDVYIHKGKNILSIGVFKNHLALVFFNGVFIDDVFNVFSTDTTAKAMRQWKLTSSKDIDENKILEYTRQAIKNSEEGKELKPEKHQPVPVNQLLIAAFEKDKNLKNAFENLTSGKQKEYSLYISEAKQETTQLKRLQKIIPMILQKIGLHDKYKNC